MATRVSLYAIVKRLTGIFCIGFFISVSMLFSSCSKDEPVQNAGGYRDAADSATARNEEKTTEANRSIQDLENEERKAGEKARSEAARWAEEDPRNIPFGSSKELEFSVKRLYDPMVGGYGRYVDVNFAPPECISSAGINAWLRNISQDDSSAQITYSIEAGGLGEGGYPAFRESLKDCKPQILVTLVSERHKTGEKGFTPMVLGLQYSEYGVRVNGPNFVR